VVAGMSKKKPTRDEAIEWSKEGMRDVPVGPLAWGHPPKIAADPLTLEGRVSTVSDEELVLCLATYPGTVGEIKCQLPLHHFATSHWGGGEIYWDLAL